MNFRAFDYAHDAQLSLLLYGYGYLERYNWLIYKVLNNFDWFVQFSTISRVVGFSQTEYISLLLNRVKKSTNLTDGRYFRSGLLIECDFATLKAIFAQTYPEYDFTWKD